MHVFDCEDMPDELKEDVHSLFFENRHYRTDGDPVYIEFNIHNYEDDIAVEFKPIHDWLVTKGLDPEDDKDVLLKYEL
jgi:hypothetical protein